MSAEAATSEPTGLVVIVPSRGRPDAARELADAFEQTCTDDTQLVFAIDATDPTREAYQPAVAHAPRAGVMVCDSETMVQALNEAALETAQSGNPPLAIGFMGDDHRPRTVGWDTQYVTVLRRLGTGIVYGNDLLQGERLPTQCAMTTDIVAALGYMAPRPLRHMYVDNFWRDLGRQADCLRYLPDVVVEHMHPVAGKSAWTEGHQRVNAPDVYDSDHHAYSAFVAANRLAQAVAKVIELRTRWHG